MRSTTPLVVLLQATSLALAAPTAFRRDQTGPAPVARATCSQGIQDQSSHLHGALQLCLRMTLSDLSTGPLTPSAVELIKCHSDDSMVVPSDKSTSSSGTHGHPPSHINAEEHRPKNGGTKVDNSPKPNSKPASNSDYQSKPSDHTNPESKPMKGAPTDSNIEGSKHSVSTHAPDHQSKPSDHTNPESKPIEEAPTDSNTEGSYHSASTDAPESKPMEGAPTDSNTEGSNHSASTDAPESKPMGGPPTDSNTEGSNHSASTDTPESKPMEGAPTDPNTEGSKHSASTDAPKPTQPSKTPDSVHGASASPKGKVNAQSTSTHHPAPNQSPSGGGSRPHETNSDTGDDGTGIPRINLDHLQPLVEVKAHVKALDGVKDGNGSLATTSVKDTVDHANVTDPASNLPSSSSVDKIADVNASVIKNPGPSDVLGDKAKATDLKKSAASKVVPQEVNHSPATKPVSQSASNAIDAKVNHSPATKPASQSASNATDAKVNHSPATKPVSQSAENATDATSQHPPEAVEASPVHDAARVDVHASATKAGVVPMI